MKDEIRPASLGDHDNILSIIPSDDYDGDYLPERLRNLMEDPLYQGYVYVAGGEIAAFVAVSFIDNGMTGCIRNARTGKQYQGKGIFIKMMQEIAQRHPFLKYTTQVTTDRDQVKGKIDKGVFKLIAVRKGFSYSGCRQKIHFTKLHRGGIADTTKILNEENLRRILSEQRKYSNVFQDERILIFAVPYKIVASNAAIILKDKTMAVASYLQNKNKTLLTFGTHYNHPSGKLVCMLDVYGTVGHTFLKHMCLHVQGFADLIVEQFIIKVRFSEYSDVIERAMEEIGLTNISQLVPQDGQNFWLLNM